jgi:class 3 adenylate cyclase/tetratricopeptide (TPR) repeat protein
MTCRSCGAELAAGARFCASCGAPVATRCTACGSQIPEAARYCPACGHPVSATEILAGRARGTASGRERKVATLLFADIVGFTGLGEAHDPELVQALVNRAFERLSAEVERYQGLVEKFAGDAMLAVFGVPSVHEDDAERAVRAALEMQAAMGALAGELRAEGQPELRLRIGLETGEVIVDQARAADERDRIVTGDAVNTAARLQQSAAPGTVLVGPSTYAATRTAIEYEDVPPVELKGKSATVAAWRAVQVKARRRGVRAPLGLEAPLIGRDEEFALLKETVRRTVAERRPHLVTVLASAGVGKSRLSWELEKYLDGLPETYHWRKGRCLAYGQTSYSALADVVQLDADVLDDDSPSDVRAKLAARTAGLAGSTPADTLIDALGGLLGLETSATLGRNALFVEWQRYLALVADRAPLVLVLEDIHWADEGLLDFIDSLARWGEGPIVILCLARHELLERRPNWAGGIANAATIVLEPLEASETEALVDSLLARTLSEELRARIVAVAEGNPLFAEEIVRMLVDRGVVRFAEGAWQQALPLNEIEIPRSVQAVLAARLDTLPPREKRTAQDAAVVGRIFWDLVLAQLAGTSDVGTDELLRGLRVKELIVPRMPSSLADADEYGFRHVLIRDVAYESLPKGDRAAKHLQVAEWAESRMAERADELVELLAAHYRSALAYQEEFGARDHAALEQLRAKTIDYARRAGKHAAELWQVDSATHWMTVAVEQSRRSAMPGIERATLIREYLEAAEKVADSNARIATASEAIDLLAREDGLDATRLRAAIEAYLVPALYEAGRVDEARARVTETLAALEPLGPSSVRADLLRILGWLEWRGGELRRALEPLERAIAEARVVGADRVERWATHDLGIVRGYLDEYERGRALLERSMALALGAHDDALLLRCYINIGVTTWVDQGDMATVAANFEEGLSRARRGGGRSDIAWLTWKLGDAYSETGRLDEAVALLLEAMRLADELADSNAQHGTRWSLTRSTLLLGRVEEAKRMYTELRSLRDPESQGVVFSLQLDAWFRWRDSPQDAVARFVADVRAALERGIPRSEEPFVYLARMATRVGDAAEIDYAVGQLRTIATGGSGPVLHAALKWARALRTAGPESVRDLQEVAAVLGPLGLVIRQADALADAALIAARARESADAIARDAQQIYDRHKIVPVLGPLPETRWIKPVVSRPEIPV